jgi:hypothetical protein
MSTLSCLRRKSASNQYHGKTSTVWLPCEKRNWRCDSYGFADNLGRFFYEGRGGELKDKGIVGGVCTRDGLVAARELEMPTSRLQLLMNFVFCSAELYRWGLMKSLDSGVCEKFAYCAAVPLALSMFIHSVEMQLEIDVHASNHMYYTTLTLERRWMVGWEYSGMDCRSRVEPEERRIKVLGLPCSRPPTRIEIEGNSGSRDLHTAQLFLSVQKPNPLFRPTSSALRLPDLLQAPLSPLDEFPHFLGFLKSTV